MSRLCLDEMKSLARENLWLLDRHANTINNAGGTDTTGMALLVVWEDWTPA